MGITDAWRISGGLGLLDTEITEFGGTDLRIDAYVENLTDKGYKVASTYGSGRPTVAVGRPRTFGIAATARF